MSFCTNCGTKLVKASKFCPSCGTKLIDTSVKKAATSNMKKGVTRSLKESASDFVESKIKETISPKVPKSQPTIAEKGSVFEVSNQPTTSASDTTKKVKKWMLYYILVNIPLYFVNTGDDEILGVLIFSVAVIIGFVLFSLQKKKEKPYTIVLKIILILQGLLAVSGIMQRLEYIGTSGYSLVAVISLALLLTLNIRIIFRRNK